MSSSVIVSVSVCVWFYLPSHEAACSTEEKKRVLCGANFGRHRNIYWKCRVKKSFVNGTCHCRYVHEDGSWWFHLNSYSCPFLERNSEQPIICPCLAQGSQAVRYHHVTYAVFSKPFRWLHWSSYERKLKITWCIQDHCEFRLLGWKYVNQLLGCTMNSSLAVFPLKRVILTFFVHLRIVFIRIQRLLTRWKAHTKMERIDGYLR